MKDSGGDPVAMACLVEETAEGFVLFTGSSKAVLLCVTAGAHGAITASSNYLPELANKVVSAARRSPRSAAELQSQLARLSTAVEAHRFSVSKRQPDSSVCNRATPANPSDPSQRKSEKQSRRSSGEAGIL